MNNEEKTQEETSMDSNPQASTEMLPVPTTTEMKNSLSFKTTETQRYEVSAYMNIRVVDTHFVEHPKKLPFSNDFVSVDADGKLFVPATFTISIKGEVDRVLQVSPIDIELILKLLGIVTENERRKGKKTQKKSAKRKKGTR